MGGTTGQIEEHEVVTQLQCARLCRADPSCTHVNMIRSDARAPVTCQLIMDGGTGPVGNAGTNSQAYHRL